MLEISLVKQIGPTVRRHLKASAFIAFSPKYQQMAPTKLRRTGRTRMLPPMAVLAKLGQPVASLEASVSAEKASAPDTDIGIFLVAFIASFVSLGFFPNPSVLLTTGSPSCIS